MSRLRLLLASVVLLASTQVSLAQIRAFTLAELAATADGIVYGEIVAARPFRVDSPVAGPDIYYTRLTLRGRTLADGRPTTIDVLHRGGFVGANEGTFTSVTPPADDVKLGTRVVAFYRWTDDAGGGVAGNLLMGGPGGLYRTVEGLRGSVVLGRGPGYALRDNVRLDELAGALASLARAEVAR